MNKTYLDMLLNGAILQDYKEFGNSMEPIISSRQPVTIAPVDTDKLEVGDIVIAKVAGRVFCHLISALDGDRVQISNNQGHVNGWTNRSKVYGIVVEVHGVPRPGAYDKIKKGVVA